MKTIAEIRLDNLRLLISEFGTQDRVAELAGTSPVYLSQILNGAADSKTGKVRQIHRRCRHNALNTAPANRRGGILSL